MMMRCLLLLSYGEHNVQWAQILFEFTFIMQVIQLRIFGAFAQRHKVLQKRIKLLNTSFSSGYKEQEIGVSYYTYRYVQKGFEPVVKLRLQSEAHSAAAKSCSCARAPSSSKRQETKSLITAPKFRFYLGCSGCFTQSKHNIMKVVQS